MKTRSRYNRTTGLGAARTTAEVRNTSRSNYGLIPAVSWSPGYSIASLAIPFEHPYFVYLSMDAIQVLSITQLLGVTAEDSEQRAAVIAAAIAFGGNRKKGLRSIT